LPTERLCRLVLLGLLPALVERDLAVFGEALHELNRLVGEAFRHLQGGIYAHPEAADLVAFLRRQGIRGVGQSSWGPTLFAVVALGQAEHVAALLRERCSGAFTAGVVIVTSAANEGAEVRWERDDVPGH
jgi:beta-RFAP synthase